MNAIVSLFENSNEERNVSNLEFLRRFSRLAVSDVVDFSKLQPLPTVQVQPSLIVEEKLKGEYILELIKARDILPITLRHKASVEDILKRASEIMNISDMNKLSANQFCDYAKKILWIVVEENSKRR